MRSGARGSFNDAYQGSPEGQFKSALGTVAQLSGPSKTQRKNAEAFGMKPQLARLQNDANRLEARKRTRTTSGTRKEQLKAFMRKR